MIDNKIADKISVSKKKSAKELPNNDDETKQEEEEDVEITTHKKIYISRRKTTNY